MLSIRFAITNMNIFDGESGYSLLGYPLVISSQCSAVHRGRMLQRNRSWFGVSAVFRGVSGVEATSHWCLRRRRTRQPHSLLVWDHGSTG